MNLGFVYRSVESPLRGTIDGGQTIIKSTVVGRKHPFGTKYSVTLEVPFGAEGGVQIQVLKSKSAQEILSALKDLEAQAQSDAIKTLSIFAQDQLKEVRVGINDC
ncbi:MAG: hypothetical protein AABX38_03255 [Candidatus Micrarchaeota archaeon]|mgnify:CR=1 FL=1